jgi:hypothetical protein
VTLIAVAGVDEHRGWANVLTVAAPSGRPVVLDRRRVELIGKDVPDQPHHHEATGLDLAEATALVERVRDSVASYTHTALGQLRSDLESEAKLVSIALREGPPRPLPATLAEILASQNAAIDADGELYRGALCDAAAALAIDVATYPRKAETELAMLALGAEPDQLDALLREIGQDLGPPWRKDHKNAVAAAIGVLGRHVCLSV